MALEDHVEKTVFDFQVKDAKRSSFDLAQFKGKPLLIVNVASACGFTPQYEGLEALYRQYKDKGFAILGFPCNQFGAQESKSDDEIQSFCKLTYDVSFPVLGKVDVNGEKAEPLFDHLKESAPGLLGTEFIKWNFTKFLVGRDGKVVKRFAPNTTPEELKPEIEKII